MTDVPFLSPIQKSDGWYAGADKAISVTVYSVLPTVAVPAGTRQPITGWAFQWELRKSADATGVALITKTSSAGQITITDGPNGVVSVAILQADTKALAPGQYHHTLSRIDSGSAAPVATGPAQLLQSDYHP